jgi:hypothetical protein
MLAALTVVGPSFVLPIAPVAKSAVRVDTPVMSFWDDIKGNDYLARNWRKMMTPQPTQQEIEELCRDDESSGCTLEM